MPRPPIPTGGHRCTRPKPEDTRLLIDGGADASTADSRGWTPLHRAAAGGHEAVARLLIDGSADASAADSGGWTPLHRAAAGGHEAVARVFRDAGY